MSKCRYCNKEITWMKEGRKNVPVEGDGTVHTCQERKDAIKSFKKIEPTTLSPEEIAKYEQAINKKK
ncbi:hypothetical protein HBN50_02345 [Halobacteriovorax sp. GB3]|uniref:hypothetical protein n=1 Tax=Halobacteriovorax sp. GB3 TaxID=2719615 RepID=UPI002360E051|nr:hypothetical protein [Halobacteriovorax sp. GB3]MDD0851913.1 hypothetical protein [Halobacteriovorax sp. GB3]